MQTTETMYEEVDDVPVSAALSVQRSSPYGSVSGLSDDELAEPLELERQAHMQDWAPVMALPFTPRRRATKPVIDGSGELDWGAFGTVDFSRRMPEFDKARYKTDRLREELRHAIIMLDMVKERLPGKAKYLVLKYIRMGILEDAHIVDANMSALAKWDRRVRRLQGEIRDLEEFSRKRRRVTALPLLEA